jgi:hypothetical protein
MAPGCVLDVWAHCCSLVLRGIVASEQVWVILVQNHKLNYLFVFVCELLILGAQASATVNRGIPHN